MINNNLKLKQILEFLQKAEKLKSVMRHSWLSTGRQESVAEHSWRIALMAILLNIELEKKVSLEKILAMVIVHDLPEIYAGDHHAWKGKLKNKSRIEERALLRLLKNLPRRQQSLIFKLWKEYEEKKTRESKFAKALDKLETIDQHNLADLKTWVKEEYAYNLVHGQKEVKFDKVLEEFKRLIDKETLKKN